MSGAGAVPPSDKAPVTSSQNLLHGHFWTQHQGRVSILVTKEKKLFQWMWNTVRKEFK